MAPGFAYPLHYDSAHANAWPPLREWACGERVPRLIARPDAVNAFRVLKDHAHMGAAIFTLQEPDRTVGGHNTHDVRIFRARDRLRARLRHALGAQRRHVPARGGGIARHAVRGRAPTRATFTSSTRNSCTLHRTSAAPCRASCCRGSSATRRSATRGWNSMGSSPSVRRVQSRDPRTFQPVQIRSTIHSTLWFG